MLRLPRPRPFIKPEKQRPKLTNVLTMGVFSLYAAILAMFVAVAVYGLCVAAWRVTMHYVRGL